VTICPGDADKYPMGYNGQLKVNEWSGIGNYLDYKERGEDTRIGRFLSIDPMSAKYPMLTPYQFASNSPMMGIDLDGLELLPINSSYFQMRYRGTASLVKTPTYFYVVEEVRDRIPSCILDDETGRIKYDFGPPMGTYGSPLKGPYFKRAEQPDFVGKTTDIGKENGPDPDQTPSSMGNKNAPTKWSNRTDKLNAAKAAYEQAKGIIENQSNTCIWNSMADVWKSMDGFYTATNMVDNSRSITTEFKTGQGRVDLINYVLDGTFPASYNLVGKTQSETRKITGYMLRLMNNAEKVLKENGKGGLRKTEYENNSSIYKIYIENGGK